MEVLAFAALAVLVAAGVAVSLYLKARRREQLRQMAIQFGLEYSPQDPFGLLGLPFRLFSRGDGRGVENVLWGEWQGVPLRACDYWYYEERTDSEGRRQRAYHRFTCAILEVPAAFPGLSVGPEGVLSRLADALGFRDIEFESEAFNRRYQVSARDRRFAYELLDARMLRWLLSLAGNLSFEVVGSWVMAYQRRVPPAGLVALIGAAAAFRARIPRVALGLYPVEEKEGA